MSTLVDRIREKFNSEDSQQADPANTAVGQEGSVIVNDSLSDIPTSTVIVEGFNQAIEALVLKQAAAASSSLPSAAVAMREIGQQINDLISQKQAFLAMGQQAATDQKGSSQKAASSQKEAGSSQQPTAATFVKQKAASKGKGQQVTDSRGKQKAASSLPKRSDGLRQYSKALNDQIVLVDDQGRPVYFDGNVQFYGIKYQRTYHPKDKPSWVGTYDRTHYPAADHVATLVRAINGSPDVNIRDLKVSYDGNDLYSVPVLEKTVAADPKAMTVYRKAAGADPVWLFGAGRQAASKAASSKQEAEVDVDRDVALIKALRAEGISLKEAAAMVAEDAAAVADMLQQEAEGQPEAASSSQQAEGQPAAYVKARKEGQTLAEAISQQAASSQQEGQAEGQTLAEAMAGKGNGISNRARMPNLPLKDHVIAVFDPEVNPQHSHFSRDLIFTFGGFKVRAAFSDYPYDLATVSGLGKKGKATLVRYFSRDLADLKLDKGQSEQFARDLAAAIKQINPSFDETVALSGHRDNEADLETWAEGQPNRLHVIAD